MQVVAALTSAIVLHDVLLPFRALRAGGVEVNVAGTRLVHQLAGVAARRPALPPVPRGGAAGRGGGAACNQMGFVVDVGSKFLKRFKVFKLIFGHLPIKSTF